MNGLIMERDNNLLLNIILRGVIIITITPSTGAIINVQFGKTNW